MLRRALINRDFALLWSASVISQTGDTFYALALAWLVLERTRSPAMMGLLLVASYLPGFLVSPWAGLLLDRWDRKRVLVASDLLRGLVVGAAALAALSGRIQVWQVMAAAILLSLASAFFNPAARMAIPRIVPEDRLVPANARLQAISGATSVAGPLLGALFLGQVGYGGAFLFNALSFLGSGALIAALRSRLAPDRAGTATDGGLREGFRFIAGNPRLRVILALVFVAHLFFGSLAVALPFLAGALSGRGLLEASLGAGLLAGSLLFGRKDRPRLEGPLFLAIQGIGAGVLLLGLFRTFGWVRPQPFAGILLLLGGGVATASIAWTTLLQRIVPDRLSGRVFAVASATGNLALPIAYGGAGLLFGTFRMATVLAACGLAILALGLAAPWAWRPARREGKDPAREDSDRPRLGAE